MVFAIALSFPGGRFHATPWGRHVNQGSVEWPPSPLRLIRTIVAVWKRKIHQDSRTAKLLPCIIEKLIEPPSFYLPPAAVGHTRHYMPWHKKWKGESPHAAKTKIFDAFIVIRPQERIIWYWKDTSMNGEELEVLQMVLSHTTYFGRSESWCDLQIVEPPNEEKLNCFPLSGVNDTREADELVSVYGLDPSSWNKWQYGKKAWLPDPPWNILAETLDLHNEAWSDFPGAKKIPYVRPKDAFAVQRAPIKSTQSREVQVVRYILDGPVLPSIRETVYTAEVVRRYILGIFGKKFDHSTSSTFCGKHQDGAPLQGHSHAFFLPTDEDGDGFIDRITIYSPEGFDEKELMALDALSRIHSPGSGTSIDLLLSGTGNCDEMRQVPILCEAATWRSITPFIPTRHYKKRGTKRDSFDISEFCEHLIREETARREFPKILQIKRLPTCELWRHQLGKASDSGRTLKWYIFRRRRVLGGGEPAIDPAGGSGFEITFAEPVTGPIALGYGCHYGLGLFAPMK